MLIKFKEFFRNFVGLSESKSVIGETFIDGEYIEIRKSRHSTEERNGISRQRNLKDSDLVDIINKASARIERRKKNYILTQKNGKWIGLVLDVKANELVIVTIIIQPKQPFKKVKNIITV